VAAVAGGGLPGMGVSVAVSVVFGAAMLAACTMLANRNKGYST